MELDVTIIIPNWNGAARLERALESVARQTGRPKAVIVVDNGSSDGSDLLAERWGACLIRHRHNLGFAVAVNVGVTAAQTDWVLVLNNDVVLDEDCLARLVHAAERHGAAFASPKLLGTREPVRMDGSFDLLARSGCAWRVGHGQPDGGVPEQEAAVQFVPLTAALLRTELFQTAGGLEERFHSYMEDVEFFLRCARLGYSGIYVPAALAHHEGSATLGAWSARMVELVSRNQLLLVARHWPEDWVMRHGRAVAVGQLLWGWMACRRGAGLAWLRGKMSALRMWREFRGAGRWASEEEFVRIVLSSERNLKLLQAAMGMERYWAVYFRWAGEGRR